jgi:hypothetical protein
MNNPGEWAGVARGVGMKRRPGEWVRTGLHVSVANVTFHMTTTPQYPVEVLELNYPFTLNNTLPGGTRRH